LYAIAFIALNDGINPNYPVMHPERVKMRVDRLGALLGGIFVERVVTHPVEGVCFWIEAAPEGLTLGLGVLCPPQVLIAAQLAWGGGTPLLKGGPYRMALSYADPVHGLAALLLTEVNTPRCGAMSLQVNYVEVLLVHILRDAISGKEAATGLMGGLADLKLSRALVAIHEKPSQNWDTESLAEIAGMSRSTFMARFRIAVGETPMAYLRHWRLNQAAEDIARGDRVGEVSRRFGYRSPDAFTRAFQTKHGRSPIEWRRDPSKSQVVTP
jgi:AraC-like DNA-binding protein